MPQTDDESGLDFVRAQVISSRNIRGRWWVDLLFGSLNYQIEHHLFPRMSRNRPRRSSVIVKEYCAANGSYRELLRFLHAVGAPLRSARNAAV